MSKTKKTSAKNVMKESLKSLTSARKLISSAKSASTKKRRKRKKRVWELKRLLVPALRRIWFYSPLRREAMKRANGACEQCGKKYDKLVADHIQPVTLVTGWDDWNGYISRMFPDLQGIQVLCKACHDDKSKTENTERRVIRSSKK